MEDGVGGLAWMLIVATPLVAFAAFRLMHRFLPRSVAPAAWIAMGALAVVIVAGKAGVRFVEPVGNIWTLATAYAAYCFLTATTTLLPWPKWARITATALAALPIMYGYVLGTVGVLALFFITYDYTDAPLEQLSLAPGVVCTKTSWGALDEGGYNLRIYRQWSPYLWREIKVISVNLEHPEGWPQHCAALRGTKL